MQLKEWLKYYKNYRDSYSNKNNVISWLNHHIWNNYKKLVRNIKDKLASRRRYFNKHLFREIKLLRNYKRKIIIYLLLCNIGDPVMSKLIFKNKLKELENSKGKIQ